MVVTLQKLHVLTTRPPVTFTRPPDDGLDTHPVFGSDEYSGEAASIFEQCFASFESQCLPAQDSRLSSCPPLGRQL